MGLDTSSRLPRRALRLVIGALALGHGAPAAAQVPPPGMACIPGAQLTCGCVGGQGVQVCKQDGSGLEPCQCAAAAPPVPLPPPQPPIPYPGSPGEMVYPPPPPPPRRGLVLGGAILGGVGGAVAVAGVVVAVGGITASNAAQAECVQQICTASGLSRMNEAHTQTTAGWILVGAG